MGDPCDGERLYIFSSKHEPHNDRYRRPQGHQMCSLLLVATDVWFLIAVVHVIYMGEPSARQWLQWGVTFSQ
eukprot:1141581-Pelagomonas_calceolata.AAC.1